MMSGKLGTSANKMVYPEDTFLGWGLLIASFKTIAYVADSLQLHVFASTKNLSRRKKVYIKVFLNQYTLRLIICNNSNWMWCHDTFNEIFFLKSQNGGCIASVNYLTVKNKVTYWKTIIPDRNQIHVAPNFLLLSS